MELFGPGTRFAGYRVEGLAGRGGMGVVYRATQVGLDRPVALKVLSPDLDPDEGFRERFSRESRLAASIDHPNVIPVFEAGEHEGRLFIAMRYVDGPDLRRLLREGLDRPRALSVLLQIGSALDAAHEGGLVHRDVKPANVLVATHGGDPHAYLTDFGVGLRLESEPGLTGTGDWVGTPDYASPEQIRGERVGPAADVYGFACLAHHVLTGVPPFPRQSRMATALAHLSEQPKPPSRLAPGLPAAVDPPLLAGLAKDPARRPRSAGELVRDLAGAVPGEGGPVEPAAASEARTRVATDGAVGATDPTAATADPTAPTAALPGRRRRRAVAAAVGLVTLVGAATALQGVGGGPEATPGGEERAGDPDAPRIEPPDPAPEPEGRAPAPDPDPGPRVPAVEGMRLDRAQERLEADGLEVSVEGGGAFGVVIRENWAVCETRPGPGSPVPEDGVVTVEVSRSC